MDEAFCVECLEEALEAEGIPEIFNTDQGSQFTGEAFTGVLKTHKIKISMDGKGRALDNVMIERLRRTVKYDDIYIRGYERMGELYQGLSVFFRKYNTRRHHTLGKSPEEKYRSGFEMEDAAYQQSNIAAVAAFRPCRYAKARSTNLFVWTPPKAPQDYTLTITATCPRFESTSFHT